MQFRDLILVIIVGMAIPAVNSQPNETTIVATSWPEADRLFHSSPYWKGADGAYSIALGGDRILWLFADTYIAFRPPFDRDECCVEMIRNSVGIQVGLDPTSATMNFYWQESDNHRGSLFPETDSTWFWPLDGIRVNDKLLIFFMQIRGISTGLGFETCGHKAVLIDNPDALPTEWRFDQLDLPSHNSGVMIGSALEEVDGYLYAFCCREPGNHDIMLARWPTDSAAAGALVSPEWWMGNEKGWQAIDSGSVDPAVLFTDGATEFSVWYDSSRSTFWQTQMSGFFDGRLVLRRADEITGPWSEVKEIYNPPVDSLPGMMVYSGKSHPQLVGGDLLLTFATNAPESLIVSDTTLYYPRFVRVRLD